MSLEDSYMNNRLKKKNSRKRIPRYDFAGFAKIISDGVSNVWSFLTALAVVLIWLITGYFFEFSDSWQFIINTGSGIVTFLMVFLIQNSQTRDTKILNLKLDELIKAHKGDDNSSIDLSKLSDENLKALEKKYEKINNKKTGN
jgi:low affinity Fe/Cu permease